MASGIDVTSLEGKKEKSEGGALIPRDFLWDSVALVVLSAIAGLTVLDIVTEYVKGSTVECFLPNGIASDHQTYVNTFCSGNLPFTQAYFPVYIMITGALIAIPHYLWLNHYRGNFEFFFSEVGNLNRPTDTEASTMTQTEQNVEIVKRLTNAFATYKQSTIFSFYVVKLIAQWLATAASLVLGVVLFLDINFQNGFYCPRNNATNAFWPFQQQVFCIYNTLLLVSGLRIAYLILICLLLICLTGALFYCFCTHATELGHEDVAKFCYLTGLPAKFYVAQLPVPSWGCCDYLRACILRCVSTIPWFTFGEGPKIRSNLDFMVLQLFRTDSGLGQAFKDVQTKLAIKDLLDDDQMRLHIHYLKHTSDLEYDERRPGTDEITDKSKEYLKWTFRKEKDPKNGDKRGLYFEYKQIPPEHTLMIPDTLLGAVLGYGACAPVPQGDETKADRLYNFYPCIMNAISISIDSVGYGTTLARTFNWVGSVNFSSSFEPQADSPPAECTHFYSNLASIVCREDVLCADTTTQSKLREPLRNLWFTTEDKPTAYETSFIAIGPIPSDNPSHLTTVDLFLDKIGQCLGKDAILLVLTPVNIAGMNVRKHFSEYKPRNSRFVKHKLKVQKSRAVLEWQARKSVQPDIEMTKKTTSKLEIEEVSATPKQEVDKSEKVAIPLLEGEETTDSESEGKGRVTQPAASHEYTHTLRCGKTKMKMKFTTYRSTNLHHRKRQKFYLPKEEFQYSESESSDSEEEDGNVQTQTTAEVTLEEVPASVDVLRQRKTDSDVKTSKI